MKNKKEYQNCTQEKLKRILTKIIEYKLFYVIGSLSIFFAWGSQNFLENDIKFQREELIHKVNTVNHLFDARRIWLESIYTHSTIKNDSVKGDVLYYIKMFNYIETSLSTLLSINEIVIEDTILLARTNDILAKQLADCYNFCLKKEYDSLTDIVNFINSPKGYDINAQFAKGGEQERKKLKHLAEKERAANSLYSGLYILGCFFISSHFLIAQRKQYQHLL